MEFQGAGAEQYGGPPQKRQQRGPTCESDEQTELKEKITIPIEQYPGYNFVGSLLGPQGSILKGLQKGVNAKISIFGKGSMRDKKKEEELYSSDDPEHAHLKEGLHVLIEVKGPRAEAHWRMANALTEVYKFMIPPPDHQQQQQQQQYGGAQGNGGYYQDQGYDMAYGGGGGGGAPMRGGRGGAPRGGPPRGGRGGAPQRGRGGAPRGRGSMLQSRGGAQPQAAAPPAQQAPAAESTNYQWDGNYNQSSYDSTQSAGGDQSANNGYSLKRPYEQSYNQQSYNSGPAYQAYGAPAYQ